MGVRNAYIQYIVYFKRAGSTVSGKAFMRQEHPKQSKQVCPAQLFSKVSMQEEFVAVLYSIALNITSARPSQ